MPKGYIRPNYIPAEEARRAANRDTERAAALARMEAARARNRRQRAVLLFCGLLLTLVALPVLGGAYPGLGLVLFALGLGMLIIWGLEIFLMRTMRRE